MKELKDLENAIKKNENKLTEHEKLIMSLYVIERLARKEIAQILNKDVKVVESIIKNVIRKVS